MSNELQRDAYVERATRTVVVVDLVESVRLIEQNEHEVVSRWRGLVDQVEKNVLPAHGGRLVKSLGDGMLLEFPRVPPALKAAFAIQHACNSTNVAVPPERHMLLRMGIQVGELIADNHDVYGRDVNLAARLTTLAGPGEIVVSANVRDQLTAMLDADIEDLGDCYLKHVKHPVRAYRVGPPGPHPVIGPSAAGELLPTLAVIPFAARSTEPENQVLGEVLADEVISALSRSTELNVISRLSTTVFRRREATVAEMCAHLDADYVLSGAYLVSDDQVSLMAELAEGRTGHVVWAKELKGDVRGTVSGKDALIDTLVLETSKGVLARELQRAQSQALPTLESHTLLIGAIALMHRLSPEEFGRARAMLQALTERMPRQAIPHAWLAKWHVLRVGQGWSQDKQEDARLALDSTRRALDADAQCSLALAMDGFVNTMLLKNLDVGLQRYELALQANPNEAIAWLLKGTLHAFRGEGKLAVKGTKRALRLSPLDPHRYFYDALAATAALAAERYERAIELAQRSWRANRTHASTLRALTIAQWQLGRTEEARKTAAELMRLEPTLSIREFVERSPSSGYETGKVWSNALRSAGVPE